jgi:aminoglycoside/choline kinase family phosphotransferase
MRDDSIPETVRLDASVTLSHTLSRAQSVRYANGAAGAAVEREQVRCIHHITEIRFQIPTLLPQDPYSGVAALLQHLGCAHLLQEFKSRGCSDATAADMKVDELVRSFSLAPVKAQVI